MTAHSSSPVMPYADLLARWGVSWDSRPGALRISIPPVQGWMQLSRRFYIALALLIAWMLVLTAILFSVARAGGGSVVGFVANLSLYGVGLLAMLAHAWRQLHYRYVIDLNERELVLSTLWKDRVTRRRAWPRSSVGEAKYNVSNGKLVIRVIGRELVEVFVSSNREVTECVARTLNESLQAPYTATQSMEASRDSSITPPMKRGWLRTSLLILAAVIAAGGIAMLFTPLAPLGFYLLLGAAAPVGIALGTQEKEFYA